ncbi:hypothetical protein MTR_4g035940 [Medicago truncatula]|uniref:Uncharacterized protein n=1 Tax=Medicago truncatula TaxID=3880 RepID=A0A072UU45_MEDTR|nr:hypothetical protein MTR_4g035940 [Medicago truncatula]
MIVMSLDMSKDHVLKKIMNNLNWSGFNEAYPDGHSRGSVMNNKLSGCPSSIFHLPITTISECILNGP